MPNKHNDDRRHHIPKMSFQVQDWAKDEAGLRRRADYQTIAQHGDDVEVVIPPRKTAVADMESSLPTQRNHPGPL